MDFFHLLNHYDEVHINNNNFINLYEITKTNKHLFNLFLNKLKEDELLTTLSFPSNVFCHKNINDVIISLSKNKNFKELKISFNPSFKLRYIKSLNNLKNKNKNVYMIFYFLNKGVLTNQDLLIFLKTHLIDEIYINYSMLPKLTSELIENNNIVNLYFFDEDFKIDYNLIKSFQKNTSIKRLDLSLCRNNKIIDIDSLKEIIQNNNTINILDLSGKIIDPLIIFDIIHNKNNITTLLLDNCQIKDPIPFLQIIRDNEQLIKLSLVNNPIKNIECLINEIENNVDRKFDLII